jgi:hypothetical protein
MNTYIEILKYGRDKLESGVTYQDLYNFLEQKELWFPNTAYSIHSTALRYIFANSFIDYKGSKPNPEEFTNNMITYPYFLTIESLSYLSNYESLESSKKAYKIAMWSLLITAVFSIISIVLSLTNNSA